MLIVTALNKGVQEGDISDYAVDIRINTRILWRGKVRNHYRPNGIAPLLRKIADEYEKKADGST